MSAETTGRRIKRPAHTTTPANTIRPPLARPRARIACPVVLVMLVFALIWTVPAFADYEQAAEHFGQTGEAAQLSDAAAIAVNVTGVGGVPAGSTYVVGRNGRVVRYGPGGEGEEPPFEEAWGWGIGSRSEGAPVEGFQRCGPALATEPAEGLYHACEPAFKVTSFGGEEIGQFEELGGVAVDQATGDVYILNGHTVGHREKHLIEVFTANGTPVGQGFGEAGRPSPEPAESIAEGPEKLHLTGPTTVEFGLAVDETGRVYVTDQEYAGIENPGAAVTRVMSFEPEHPGEYEHYVYAGQAKDISVPTSTVYAFRRIALVGPERLVAAGENVIVEYSTSGGSTPVCTDELPGAQVGGLAANTATGEVFYSTHTNHELRRLGACDSTTGKFSEVQTAAIAVSPSSHETMVALAVNPVLRWGADRPPGVLYGAKSEFPAIGDVFVPAKVFPPAVTGESVVGTGLASSTLQAELDPHGYSTHYSFQYLTESEYQANEPDERQSVAVAGGGGVFGLAFEGRGLGGAFTGDLTAGSSVVSSVVTGAGSATLSAATGTATLSGAVGKGTVIAGSVKVTAVSATSGVFASGEILRGSGIPEGDKIIAVSGTGGELTLSAAATESIANIAIKAGTSVLTGVVTTEGAFEAGQDIEGPGIPSGATITAISGSEVTLSTAVERSGTGVVVKAGSTTLTAFTTSEGVFEVGDTVVGEGIAAGTTVLAVKSSSLVLSKAVFKAAARVAVSSAGPSPLAVGEHVEGPGIPSGTTIVAANAGELTLSALAGTTASGAHLHAGLPFDASAGEVASALEGLGTVGVGNVSVWGGPGDASGSSPYVVEFVGALANEDLPVLSADGSGLTGGSPGATVQVVHNGGGGFTGAREAPAGGGQIPSGNIGLASAGITGLTPDTAYRFRVIASSECEGEGVPACESVGEPATFATYPSVATGIPDDRAYELVSPPEKHGGEVFPAEPEVGSCSECKPPGDAIPSRFPMQSAPDGEGVAYNGYPFSSTEPVFDSYISRRTATGWQTSDVSPALQYRIAAGPVAFDPSLDVGLVYQENPQLSPEAPTGYANLYLQHTTEPDALTPLLTRAMFESHPPKRNGVTFKLSLVGHSSDLSRVFMAVNDALTGSTPVAPKPSDPGVNGRDLYEWHEGSLALVNILPGNTEVAEEAAIASESLDNHAVSADGRRVYWNSGATLYVREGGQVTREVRHHASFVAASEDGSRVLLSDGCLYSLATEACTELTEGQGGFQGIAGQSTDLSHIYFVDTAALTGAGENERHEIPQPGKDNLYAWQAGATPHYIATLSGSDEVGLRGSWEASPVDRTAEASPDGRYLAFMAIEPLTGYDNIGPCASVGHRLIAAPCAEVFLYDSTTGHLTCASCNPTGEEPLGHSTLRLIYDSSEAFPQPQYLTDQGRLYFDSQDRLSPLDTNGNVEDVYEYEPVRGPGEPAGDSCERAGGCVLLISPGTGSADSNFLAMDENGKNVFFTTRERLVPLDNDELIDVYDARETGGFLSATETQRGECQGEACQSTPTPPVFTTPGSSTFSGLGNFLPAAVPVVKPKVKKVGLTGAEKRVKALRVCHEKHVKRKRLVCEKRARHANEKTNTKTKKHGGAK